MCAAGKSGRTLDPNSFPPEMRQEVEEVSAAYQKYPDEAAILYQVAALQARAGKKEEALETLKHMAAQGTGADPRSREFAALKDDREFQRLKAQIRKDNPAVLRARLAYVVNEGDLMPEGIAYSATTHKLYLGSHRKIMSVAEDGGYEQFVPTASGGLADVLGIRVDDQRGELWAVSNAIGERKADMVLGLFRFRLADGKLIKAYAIDSADKEMLNDVAVTKDGSAYATATNSGALYRVDTASDNVEKFLPDKSLPDPNGIVATEDGKSLFIAGWYSVSKVELRKKQVYMLDKPRNVADGCLDGLYLYREMDLIGVQNCVHETGRVMRYHLDPTRTRIVSAQVLASYDPMFDGITTAAIAGDELYFVANTQLYKAGKKDEQFEALKILRLNLK
jgi:sugar lactone lactonase YvrE